MDGYKAALIDLDGFLINSEDVSYKASRTYFGGLGYGDLTEEIYGKTVGLKSEIEIRRYKEEGLIQTDLDVEGLIKGRGEVYYEIAKKELKLMPGAGEFLAMVHKRYKTALVTSSSRKSVDFVFNMFGIGKYFDEVVSGDMVKNGKPNPDPYLLGAKVLGVKAAQCLVFEDSPKGILSGKAAGMKVIAVPSRFVIGNADISKADVVCANLSEVCGLL